MKLLKTIKDEDFGLINKDVSDYKKRTAVRAIVFDSENKVALLNVSQYGYHKLPGGGVEDGEQLAEALNREVMEEIGCNIKVSGELGRIVEFRDEFELEQESLCYLAKVIGKKGNSNFTEEEANQGFAPFWTCLENAIDILRADSPKNYEGKFIKVRDLCFLEEAKLNLK
jgi:8-oxo-dGTP pyrophosphatase MutT (NUDIX family)